MDADNRMKVFSYAQTIGCRGLIMEHVSTLQLQLGSQSASLKFQYVKES